MHDNTSLHFDVSDAGFENLPGQVQDAIRFLETNYNAILFITQYPGVDFAVLDFGIVRREVPVQVDHWPPELLRLVGSLSLGIDLTQYAFDVGEERN